MFSSTSTSTSHSGNHCVKLSQQLLEVELVLHYSHYNHRVSLCSSMPAVCCRKPVVLNHRLQLFVESKQIYNLTFSEDTAA